MKPAIVFLSLFLVAIGSSFGQGTRKSDPCADAQSQAEMTICAGKEYKSADATLNQVYRQLVAKLNDEERAELKDAQTAWLKYRDANCTFVADQYKGGTIRPMIEALCLADVTRNRTAELRNQIKDRNN